MRHVIYVHSVRIEHCVVPLRIALKYYYHISRTTNKCTNISLPVFSVQIYYAVIDYARHARIIIEELDPVALFDNTVVAVVGIGYIPFAQSPAQTVM